MVFGLIGSKAARAEGPCPAANLPAYSHNDYENARPLTEALRLGFRGVEVDVFLVNGILRVGHDLRQARSGPTLEAAYLRPLRAVGARCGSLTIDRRPWFLAIEIKESSKATYNALLRVLGRYRDLFTTEPPSPGGLGAVEVVLVGWHPKSTSLNDGLGSFIWHQHRISQLRRETGTGMGRLVRLVSIDYGKTMGRGGPRGIPREEWLAMLREIKRANPERLLRVHNLPADSTLYLDLLEAGVELLGTKELARTRRLLTALADN